MACRILMLTLLALAACGPATDSPVFSVPETLAGQYALSATSEPAAGEIPESVSRLGLRYAVRADYAGPAELQVTFYEMTTDPAAFEAVQQWRPAAGKLCLHHGSWFVVLESAELDTAALTKLANAIEPLLP